MEDQKKENWRRENKKASFKKLEKSGGEVKDLHEEVKKQHQTVINTQTKIYDGMTSFANEISNQRDRIKTEEDKHQTNINNITIGGFINTKINQIGKIEDSNCFIFTNKNNQMTKYSIQKDKSQNAFELYSQQDSILFAFGNDIIVYKEDKENKKDKSYVNERKSCFEYGKERRVLLGKIGTFSIKRIQVIQME